VIHFDDDTEELQQWDQQVSTIKRFMSWKLERQCA
jgi:hypothetical protein